MIRDAVVSMMLACTIAGGAGEEPVRLAGHPRLYVTAAELPRLRKLLRDERPRDDVEESHRLGGMVSHARAQQLAGSSLSRPILGMKTSTTASMRS